MQKYFELSEKKVDLDWKDKKILEQLNKNARMSIANIARKTGIPKDSVLYRLRKMEKSGVFSYAVVINPLKMGLPVYTTTMFKIFNMTPEVLKKMTGFAKQHKNVVYSTRLSGKYNFVLAIVAKSMVEMDGVLNEFLTKFKDNIKDYDVHSVLEEYKFDYAVDMIEDK